MPKIWKKTIETHRNAIREAILDATALLVHKEGLTSVTMSQVAQTAGIGRATLYKYFSDIEAVLTAWHERQVSDHLKQLMHIGTQTGATRERLAAVLEAYAFVSYGRHDTELATLLHRGKHVDHAQQHLRHFIADLLAQAAMEGDVRDDVSANELAAYCIHAVAAASSLTSKAAVRRLVSVTLDGLHPAPH